MSQKMSHLLNLNHFFGPSQVGPHVEIVEYGDQSSRDVFPNLGSAPTSSSELPDIDQSIPQAVTPTSSPQLPNCNEQATQ